MSAPVKEKPGSITDEKVLALSARLMKRESLEKLRNISSVVLFVSASAIWLLSLIRVNPSNEIVPWYVTLGVLAAFSVRFLSVKEADVVLIGLPRSKEPLLLRESLAVCFLVTAVLLYVSAGIAIFQQERLNKARLTQVVDIEFVSKTDFQDNNEQLPGMQEFEEVRKRSADMVSQAGQIAVSKLTEAQPVETKKPQSQSKEEKRKPVKSEGKSKSDKEDKKLALTPSATVSAAEFVEPPKPSAIVLPASWQTKVVKDFAAAAAVSATASQSRASQPLIAEVEPPELVELMENDGAPNATHVFQKGGKSNNGKGAENGLSMYLKELHRKIKNSWAPPMGSDRQVVIIFRLRKNGTLESMKLSSSSGEPETDKSAFKAISLATKQPLPLPKDFSAESLDVLYTFKYNVNELKEIPNKGSSAVAHSSD